MFTAIKSFVEDAFKQKSQELEVIEYGTYKIFVQSFHSYYIATVLSGSLSAVEKDKLSWELLDFAEHELKQRSKTGITNENPELVKSLVNRFINSSEMN